MVTSALTAFLASVIAFILLIVITQQERRRGRRFFAPSSRSWLDKVVAIFEQKVIRSFNHFMKYIVQLNWYYSIHSVLRTILKGLIAVYTYFENVFERNRKRTKELRAEKRQLNELNHLRQMAVHREDTALTPAEKQKLRKKTLEGSD
jgi:p-aminobenzoyl-glutamate transporter AbgT